jgi:hypothetical protein
MTQAFNLSLFANKLNTSGQTDNTGLQNSSITINTTSPITGGAATALGSSITLAHANSGVTATSYTNANITVNAQGHITAASNGSVTSGTVTSVATGNGLSGGTITSTGTLVIAAPAYNSVGSYIFAFSFNSGEFPMNNGQSYSAGNGDRQIQAGAFSNFGDADNRANATNNLSGTWRWMSATTASGGYNALGVAVRVS